MIVVFRSSLVVSMVALVMMLALPYERPYEASFPIDQPPLLPMLMALCALLSLILMPAAAYGLTRFRRWGRVLAMAAAIPLLGLVAITTLPVDIGAVVSIAAKVAGLIAAASWLLAVALMQVPQIRQRFASSAGAVGNA